jgi:hypothetical protein
MSGTGGYSVTQKIKPAPGIVNPADPGILLKLSAESKHTLAVYRGAGGNSLPYVFLLAKRGVSPTLQIKFTQVSFILRGSYGFRDYENVKN